MSHNKEKRVGFRITTDEYNEIVRQAEKHGLTVSNYLRHIVTEREFKYIDDREKLMEYSDVLKELKTEFSNLKNLGYADEERMSSINKNTSIIINAIYNYLDDVKARDEQKQNRKDEIEALYASTLKSLDKTTKKIHELNHIIKKQNDS